MIDEDTQAFNDYLAAVGMPKDPEQAAKARQQAMQEGLKKAVQVPLKTMQIGDRCWEAMIEMAAHGNPASRSDLEVGARALEVGIWGAYRNVVINLKDIEDETFRKKTSADAEAMVARARQKANEVLKVLESR